MIQDIPHISDRVGGEIDSFQGLIQFVLLLKGLLECLEYLFPRSSSNRTLEAASIGRSRNMNLPVAILRHSLDTEQPLSL